MADCFLIFFVGSLFMTYVAGKVARLSIDGICHSYTSMLRMLHSFSGLLIIFSPEPGFGLLELFGRWFVFFCWQAFLLWGWNICSCFRTKLPVQRQHPISTSFPSGGFQRYASKKGVLCFLSSGILCFGMLCFLGNLDPEWAWRMAVPSLCSSGSCGRYAFLPSQLWTLRNSWFLLDVISYWRNDLRVMNPFLMPAWMEEEIPGLPKIFFTVGSIRIRFSIFFLRV